MKIHPLKLFKPMRQIKKTYIPNRGWNVSRVCSLCNFKISPSFRKSQRLIKQMLKPVKHKQYYVPEAPYPFPPIRSGILLGSSGQGKSHLMLSLLMGAYKNLHSRVMIASPGVHVDPLW